MDTRNGASTEVARKEEKRGMSPALPTLPSGALERVDETCLALMKHAQQQKQQAELAFRAQCQAIDMIVNTVVAERAHLIEGDTVDAEGVVRRGSRPEPAPTG